MSASRLRYLLTRQRRLFYTPLFAAVGFHIQREQKPTMSPPNNTNNNFSMTPFKVPLPPLSVVKIMQTQYAVTMECQDCVNSISNILKEIKGVNSFDVSLEDQSVLVEGTVAPSKITKALRESGRAAVLRGSGDSGDGLGYSIL